jgi:hypothetical protein
MMSTQLSQIAKKAKLDRTVRFASLWRLVQCLCPGNHSRARNFLQLLVLGIRIRAKRPARSAPQTSLKPRNSNVSGLCPCLRRSTGIGGRKTPEEQQPSFLLGQFQIELRKTFPQLALEVQRVSPEGLKPRRR